MDALRKPFFIVALIAILMSVLVEIGSVGIVSQNVDASAAALDVSTAGKAIPALALLDSLVLFATTVMGVALLIPERVQSKVQGGITLVFAILLILAAVVIFFKDLTLLILMVSLLMAPIFGTIAYFLIWASFGLGTAQAALSLVLLLKMIYAVFLVLAQQRFLENKGLVLIIASSFVANLVIAFLYHLVPGVFESIADDLAALVLCVFAIIWAVVYLIGGVVSVVKVVV